MTDVFNSAILDFNEITDNNLTSGDIIRKIRLLKVEIRMKIVEVDNLLSMWENAYGEKNYEE